MFNDPELEGFFNHLSSYQILMDLLFINQKFEQILDVYKTIQEKQLQIAKFPKGVMLLVFASCYKLVSYEHKFLLGFIMIIVCTSRIKVL